MAASVVATGSKLDAASGTSLSVSITVPSGCTHMVAFLSTRGSGGGAYVTNVTAKWMDTPGGTSFTHFGFKDHSNTFYLSVNALVLANPSAGTSTVDFAWTGTAMAVAGVFCFSGTTTPSATTILTDGGTGSPMQVNITSVVGDIAVGAVCMEGNTTDTLTIITGNTESWNAKNSTVYGAGGYEEGEADGAALVGWTIGNRACMLAFNMPQLVTSIPMQTVNVDIMSGMSLISGG